MSTTHLGARIRALDPAIEGRFRQYYALVSLSLLLAGMVVVVIPTANILPDFAVQIDVLPGATRIADAVGATACAPFLPALLLAQIFLSLMLGLCWLIFLGSILPRVLAATRQLARDSIVPRTRPGLVDHGIERQDAKAPSRPISLFWLLLGLAAGTVAILPPHLLAAGCRDMANPGSVDSYAGWLAVFLVWGIAFTAPHALLHLLQSRTLNARWASNTEAPHRPSRLLQAEARQRIARLPLARNLPKAEMPASPAHTPIEDDGTPVSADTPRYVQPHELFKAMAALWAGEVAQAARTNDDYPTGFMQGRRQFYEFLAKSARKQEGAFRHSRRQQLVTTSRRQLLKDQIDMCQKALTGARRHSSDLAPQSPERRATLFEIDVLRQHIADLEGRLHGE